MRRRLAAGLTAGALLGAALATTLAVAAAPRHPSPSTLELAVPGPFGGCDPGATSTTPATDAVLALVLPSAFTPGPLDVAVGDTQVIAQAEVVATSPQTVVYTIAPGITWPSGRPFVAADLVRTWRERRDDAVLADLGYRDVADVVADPTGASVTVTFRTPYSDWASLFDLIVPGPTAHASCTVPTATLDPSIGPYSIVAATRERVTLEANPLWPDPPGFPRIVVTADPTAPVPPGATPRVAYVPAPSGAELEALTSTGAYSSTVAPSATVVDLDFAVHGVAALPLDARRGVAALVDRQAIVDRLASVVDPAAAPPVSHLFGQGEPDYLGVPATGAVAPPPAPLTPTGARGPDAYGPGADPADAAAWLGTAGYVRAAGGWETPTRAPFSVCVAVPEHDVTLQAAARDLVAQLHAGGVGVATLDVATDADVVTALRHGTCATGLVVRDGDGFATHAAAAWLRSGAPIAGLTWTGVDDPLVATTAATATAELNAVTAGADWSVTDARLWTLMVGLPLYSPSAYLAWTPSVAGVTPCDTTAGCVGEVPTLLPATTSSS